MEQGTVTIVQKEAQRSAALFEGIEASRPFGVESREQRQARDAVVRAISSINPRPPQGSQEVGRPRFTCKLSKEPGIRGRQRFCWYLRSL